MPSDREILVKTGAAFVKTLATPPPECNKKSRP